MTDDLRSSDLHAKVDTLTAQMDMLTRALGLAPGHPVQARHGTVPDRLTAAEVMRTTFATTRLATGYSIEHVDQFMVRAAAEIAQLTEERDAALRQLAERRS